MKTSNQIPACGYARGSTSAQWEKESPDIQWKMIHQYCALHRLCLTKIYEDQWSGAKDDRPGLNELFTDAEKGLFKRVIFSRLDRFGRSLKFILECYDRLEALGIAVVSINENIDTSTPIGILLRNILVWGGRSCRNCLALYLLP